jgi:dTDP-4-amino-4,6-dideoxy-D-galactose acyltransferase
MTLPILQQLPWDSDFLGFPVGRLLADGLTNSQLTASVAEARTAGVRLLYVVAGPTNTVAATAMQAVNGQLVDRKFTFAMPTPDLSGAPVPAAIIPTTTYTPELESLAWQSGEYSRFRLDPHFAPSVFQGLYSEWLRNSLSGAIARQVLVWRTPGGRELGLLTLGEKNGRADIGLLAVDASTRGQGVGQQLVAAALAQATNWGYAELQVVTQGDNTAACHFYEKCGFTLDHEEHIYHCWLV